jgi:hypothetical protein
MALNTSGPISLGGATVGQSINLELGQASTTTASLNDSNVRTLAGVATGVITMPTNFYGKSTGPTIGMFYAGTISANSNLVTRINSCGVIIGSQTNVGTARYSTGGATVGSNGLFYGGCYYSNLVTRINSCGALVGSQTNVGTQRRGLAGATVGSNGLFYGGQGLCPSMGFCLNMNKVTRINSSGTIVGSETSVGTARFGLGGANVGSNGLFYGGLACGNSNLVTRINSCGALVGVETNVGTARYSVTGAGL